MIMRLVCLLFCGFIRLIASAAEDKRPDYLKVNFEQYGSYCARTPFDASGNALISMPGDKENWPGTVCRNVDIRTLNASPDPFNFKAQAAALQSFFSEGNDRKASTTTIRLETTSVVSSQNPTVILWLHGSSGPDHPTKLIEAVFGKDMAFATFSRFKVNQEPLPNGKAGYIETYDETWNDQTSLGLALEVAMVYGVCEALVARGTQGIIIAGHSRGGTLALQCAMESNAQHFRNIKASGKIGSVIGYLPVSALPIAISTLTKQEQVVLVHGKRDAVCDYQLMRRWCESLLNQQNIKLVAGNFGHQPFDNEAPLFKSIFTGLWSDLGCYFTSMSGISRSYNIHVNFFNRSFAWLGLGKGWTVTSWMPQAQNFNAACFAISDDGNSFSPFGSDQQLSADSLQGYVEKNMTTGVKVTEVLEADDEVNSRIGMIVYHFQRMQSTPAV